MIELMAVLVGIVPIEVILEKHQEVMKEYLNKPEELRIKEDHNKVGSSCTMLAMKISMIMDSKGGDDKFDSINKMIKEHADFKKWNDLNPSNKEHQS